MKAGEIEEAALCGLEELAKQVSPADGQTKELAGLFPPALVQTRFLRESYAAMREPSLLLRNS
jgi:hypothetical protein